MQDDSELQLNRDFARLAAGDRSAFTVVFHGLWPKVHRFCRQSLQNDHDADDAAQRTLEKLFAQAADHDGSRSVVAWAYAIAMWECRTIRRRSTRRKTESLSPGIFGSEPSPEQAVEREQLRVALDAAIGRLSEVDQGILRSILAADDALGAPTGSTFRKQKQRAIVRLRETLRRLYDS
jgi:RNA polymerase sigma-70 factor (ECF subfamily)